MRMARLTRSRWLWLAGALLVLWGLIVAADRLWPLPLKEVNPARVVVDEKGTPLWRFADSDGIWRYPVTIEEVSPRYLEALIQYEDRWFWDHPGVNPLSVLRAAWQDLSSGKVVSGGSTLTMQVARLLDPHPRTFGGKLRQLWTSYLALGGTALVGVMGAACMIEMTYHLQLNAALGPELTFLGATLNAKGSLFLTRPSLAAHTATTEEYQSRAQDVLDAIAAGILTPRIWKSYALKDAALAHADLEQGRSQGSIILTP